MALLYMFSDECIMLLTLVSRTGVQFFTSSHRFWGAPFVDLCVKNGVSSVECWAKLNLVRLKRH